MLSYKLRGTTNQTNQQIMQAFHNNKAVDPSSLIMRNPYQSMSGSRKSSKFGQMENHEIHVQQFQGNQQTDRFKRENHIIIGNQNQNRKQMKYNYSFCDQQIKSNHLNICNQNQNGNFDKKEKINQSKLRNNESSQETLNYPQRLTFENKNSFVNPQPLKNNVSVQEKEQRHSFNPLHNKINDLQKMYKSLYKVSIQQNIKYELQRQSVMRIQKKIDFLVQILQHSQLNQKNCNKLSTRGSNQNKKRSSIPVKNAKTSKFIDKQTQNSSQKLSRYLQAPSSLSQQLYYNSLLQNNIQPNQKLSHHHRKSSKGIKSGNNTKRTSPFMVNSIILNNQSIPQLYGQNYTIQFDQNEQEWNKQNIEKTNNVRGCEKNKVRKKSKVKNVNTVSNQVKQSQKYNGSKQLRSRKLSNKKPASKQNNRFYMQQKTQAQQLRANSQATAKTQRQGFQPNNGTNCPDAKDSRQVISMEQIGIQNIPENNSDVMNHSVIFKAVDMPYSQFPQKQHIKQFRSSELASHKNKDRKDSSNLPNRTLLQSIQQKRKTINKQLQKRLIRNSEIIYGGSSYLQ